MTLPEEAYALAIGHFGGLTRKQLVEALQSDAPSRIWSRMDVVSPAGASLLWRNYVRSGIAARYLGGSGYPAKMRDMSSPPPIVFAKGKALFGPASDNTPAVAIVGTRLPTSYGRETAYWLGKELASSGVTVISGLAVGIDASAHEGALSVAGSVPVAVVANGLDIVYPYQNRDLYRRIEQRGVVLSESLAGSKPEKWRFPLRNRLIAALADVAVVVESDYRGGSMSTVQSALELGRTVMAVPGPIGQRQSKGTNALIRDGAVPLTHIDDVKAALSLASTEPWRSSGEGPEACLAEDDVLASLGSSERLVMGNLTYRPKTIEAISDALPEISIPNITMALERLREIGVASEVLGTWSLRAGGMESS